MSRQTYRYLCEVIFQRSRIHLGDNKLTLLTSRLSKQRRSLGLPTWEAYVEWLQRQGDEEFDTLIDQVATNHTHFFREMLHFERLRDSLLAEVLDNCATARRELRCWSAACSSGEEPFSLAMVLSEYQRQQEPAMNWRIVATDISRKALRKAQQGIYEMDRLNLPDAQWLKRYFQRGSGPFEGQCKVKPELAQKVEYLHANLFAERTPVPWPQHIIFCRNVLIYFEPSSQAQLIQKLHEVLEPGGLLIVGHSDSLLRIQHPFKALGSGIFQRVRAN